MNNDLQILSSSKVDGEADKNSLRAVMSETRPRPEPSPKCSRLCMSTKKFAICIIGNYRTIIVGLITGCQ